MSHENQKLLSALALHLTPCKSLASPSCCHSTYQNCQCIAGYDEAAATPPERLLAHTLQEVLLLHSPPGSSVYPVAVDEDDASDTQLDARWPKSTLKLVLQAAHQPYRVNEFKMHLAGEDCGSAECSGKCLCFAHSILRTGKPTATEAPDGHACVGNNASTTGIWRAAAHVNAENVVCVEQLLVLCCLLDVASCSQL
jgi:hypothetical protein